MVLTGRFTRPWRTYPADMRIAILAIDYSRGELQPAITGRSSGWRLAPTSRCSPVRDHVIDLEAHPKGPIEGLTSSRTPRYHRQSHKAHLTCSNNDRGAPLRATNPTTHAHTDDSHAAPFRSLRHPKSRHRIPHMQGRRGSALHQLTTSSTRARYTRQFL